MNYGQPPAVLGKYTVVCREMMFYQYLPIKLEGSPKIVTEDRLACFGEIIGTACCDYVGEYGLNAFVAAHIYLTAKCLYQYEKCMYNRPGWHSDGFMTEDVNYIWSDKNPTEFNLSKFNLTQDDKISMKEMEQQADWLHNITYGENTLLRLNQFNIHRVAEHGSPGIRTFLKISFSKDRYDLIGNAHNYKLNYDWEMKERKEERNIPQTIIK